MSIPKAIKLFVADFVHLTLTYCVYRTCVGFGSVNGSWFGPVGVDPSWAGRLEIHTQDVFHSDARSCNALCTSNGNASYSSMVQIGGQLGCVCVKVTEEERATMVSSQGCSACQVFPPRTPMPDLGEYLHWLILKCRSNLIATRRLDEQEPAATKMLPTE